MFRALLCPSSVVRDFNVDYHIGRFRSWFAVGSRLGAVRLEWYQVAGYSVELCFSLQTGHCSSRTALNLQHTANQGMCNVRFTTLMNTNNTLNYQSTNETHRTQQNTTISRHKRSQLLISTETRYQVQPSDKELHTEHTPLTYLLSYLLTYLLTYLLHGVESFLRS